MTGNNQVVWLMGLSGSGKSTVANRIAAAHGWTVLDSDDLRPIISPDLGWTEEDRTQHASRLALLAKVLSKQSLVIVCCVTPVKSAQNIVEEILEGTLNMIWLDCPLTECQLRREEFYRGHQKSVISGVNFPFDIPRGATRVPSVTGDIDGTVADVYEVILQRNR